MRASRGLLYGMKKGRGVGLTHPQEDLDTTGPAGAEYTSGRLASNDVRPVVVKFKVLPPELLWYMEAQCRRPREGLYFQRCNSDQGGTS